MYVCTAPAPNVDVYAIRRECARYRVRTPDGMKIAKRLGSACGTAYLWLIAARAEQMTTTLPGISVKHAADLTLAPYFEIERRAW